VIATLFYDVAYSRPFTPKNLEKIEARITSSRRRIFRGLADSDVARS